jgi:phytoene dehydrogenase-like protein
MRVLVIGGGFAGLSAAAALTARGHAVRLLDAAPGIGGKAHAIEAADARVDLGPTILADLEPLRNLFEAGGVPLEQAVTLARVDPALVATFPGGKTLALRTDQAATTSEFAALGPAARDDWERVLVLGARAARLAAHFYAHGDVASPREFVRFLLGPGARLDDVATFARHGSLAHLLAAYVRTPELRWLLGHCARFLGVDAHRAPAVALVIPYLFATTGIWYPLGGLSALARAVCALAVKHGAEIETGVSVDRLEIARHRVVAAVTADGRRIAADACVAAVDAGVTARWVPGRRAARAAEPTYAARVAWWIVEGAPRIAAHHAFHFDAGDDHPLYVAVPTLTDPALAPAGASVLYALVHARPGPPAGDAFAEDVKARLVRAAAWPAGRVLAHGVAGGADACYGSPIGSGLFASFRPSQRVPGVANLVRAGGSVFPGPGVANVIRSGVRAAELIAGGART